MTGRTLDAYKQVPKRLWQHLGEQLGIDPPDLGTLRVLYDDRTDTLADHQKLAYETLGFQPMAEHQRHYVVRWLKERLSGRQDRSTALLDLKQWLYEYRVLIVHDRALRQLMMIALERTKAQIRARVSCRHVKNLFRHRARCATRGCSRTRRNCSVCSLWRIW